MIFSPDLALKAASGEKTVTRRAACPPQRPATPVQDRRHLRHTAGPGQAAHRALGSDVGV